MAAAILGRIEDVFVSRGGLVQDRHPTYTVTIVLRPELNRVETSHRFRKFVELNEDVKDSAQVSQALKAQFPSRRGTTSGFLSLFSEQAIDSRVDSLGIWLRDLMSQVREPWKDEMGQSKHSDFFSSECGLRSSCSRLPSRFMR